jgi:tetratricopeptide (TPR) repeat protein
MSTVARLKRRAAEHEQKKQLDKALDLYIQILDEGGRDLDDDDVPLYNRVGDLLTRNGRVHDALGYYERAVDVYAERGYLNNAIALCNKILRQSPGRTAVYYKLGKISASKGFRSDARKNFLEYADRMQKAGNLEEAVRALKEFAGFYPDEEDIRLMLAEQLTKENRKGEAIEQLQALYEKLESEGRQAEARATVDRMKAIDPNIVPRPSGNFQAQKRNDLVFLDLSDREGERRPPTPRASPLSKSPTVQSRVPALEGLSLTFVPDEESRAQTVSPVEGFTTTSEPAATAPLASERGAAAGHEDELALEDATSIPSHVPASSTPPTLQATAATTTERSEAIELDIELPAEAIQPHVSDAVDVSEVVGEPETIEPPPLSGVEFAELDLAEVRPQNDNRAHDFALPTELPLLDEAAQHTTGEHEGQLAGATVTEDGVRALDRQESTADSELEQPDNSDEPAVQEASTAASAPPPSDLAYRRAVVLTDPDFAIVDDVPPTVRPVLPQAPEPQESLEGVTPDLELAGSRPERSSDATDSSDWEDLLTAAPSFGGEADPDSPAFPPIPGLSDESSASPGAPMREGNRRRRKRGRREDTAQGPASTGLPTPENSPSPLPNERAASPPPKVEAPLPQGFEGVVDEDARAEPSRAGGEGAGATWERAGHASAHREQSARTPRSTVSLGGADAQLRSRLELDPENWPLRRQLGEVLLDTGNRDAGLYELELAMVGFELTGNLDRAQEVADEIIRVLPASVRHHQKRVEYAVRSKDRNRLVDAYLELADALFRTGEGDKSVAVYSRVVELSPENERALFALATLAPDDLTRLRGGVSRAGRWSEELEAIPEGGPFTRREPPAGLAVGASKSEESSAAPTPVGADALPETSIATTAPATAPDQHSVGVSTTELASHETVPSGAEPDAKASVASSGDGSAGHDSPSDLAPDESAASAVTPHVVDAVEKDRPQAASKAVDAADRSTNLTPSPTSPRSEPQILDRARSMTPSLDDSSGFVDLGDWLRQTEPMRSTRMVVEDAKPSGDERADFEEMLRRFKRGVAENVDAEDFDAHYDLGVAFKEMGLLDEAIAQFQKALRGTEQRIRSYEALGQCFVEKAQYPIAAALLQRAVESPGTDDQQLVGVLYLLGFAHEQTGRPADALRYYQRVFAVDLEFRDITQRVAAMELLTK